MRPDAIGIGAQKCASSWIHSVAGSHPEIGTSTPKEVDFFSYHYDRGYLWYESHFQEAPTASLYFESSPSYFHDPRAPMRVRNYHTEMKVLVLLRDPLKRALSNHMHEIIKGHIPTCPFETGLANNPAYVEQGLYATHLERWYDAFPQTQIKVMFAEDIAADAGRSARELFAFLAVNAAFDSPILHERRNESDRARLPYLRVALRAGGDWMRRRGLEPTLTRLKATRPIAALLGANKIEIRQEIPPMAPETARQLAQIFEPEMDRLRMLLNRDTLPWEVSTSVAAQ